MYEATSVDAVAAVRVAASITRPDRSVTAPQQSVVATAALVIAPHHIGGGREVRPVDDGPVRGQDEEARRRGGADEDPVRDMAPFGVAVVGVGDRQAGTAVG